MGNQTAKFMCALFASFLAGTSIFAMSQNVANAKSARNTGDCLTSPKGTAPEGQHWYYRVDRDTKKQCWYLHEKKDAAAQSVTTADSRRSTTVSRSIRDAHAELISPQSDAVPDSVASQPAKIVPQVTPPTTTETNANALQPTPTIQPAPTLMASADMQPAPEATAAGATSATAETPATKPTASLQTLLLIVGGALLLAGGMASVTCRFGRSRAHTSARRRVDWGPIANDNRGPQPQVANSDPYAQQSLLAASPTISAEATKLATRIAAATEVRTTYPTTYSERSTRSPKPPTAAMGQNGQNGKTSEAESDPDAIDINAITAMLERLAKEGPRLNRPISAAGSADLGRNRRGQSGARA